ncbi:hypothetical protein AJ78_04280, partial [Emergomyces pasteurianus Ep9510]
SLIIKLMSLIKHISSLIIDRKNIHNIIFLKFLLLIQEKLSVNYLVINLYKLVMRTSFKVMTISISQKISTFMFRNFNKAECNKHYSKFKITSHHQAFLLTLTDYKLVRLKENDDD